MRYVSITAAVCAMLVCLFCFAPIVHGQFNDALATNISLALTPENPGPQQLVQASLSSYSTDLNAATISWSINDKQKLSGKGQTSFSFTTGAANSTTRLVVGIITAQGETIYKTYSIQPSSVDLIWQATGYTPPFYKGKTLFAHQDMLTFIAIPHLMGANGSEIPASRLIYTWTKNGTVLGDYSGYGKNTYTMIGSIISRPIEMEVWVSSPDSGATGDAGTTVTPIDPEVVLYEKDPLYGIQFGKALTDTVSLKNKEIEIIGTPYFFSTIYSHDPRLSYSWSINGSTVNEDTTQTSQIFRQQDNTNGSSLISLSIQNADTILQYAESGFTLKFGGQSSPQTQNTF